MSAAAPSTAPPALVLLAAGASARLGQPKALAALRDGPGGSALELLLAAGAVLGDTRPLVVAGRDAALLATRLPAGVELALNVRWAEGRTGSVQLAQTLRPGRDLCLAPVDVPLVPSAVFAALAREWARQERPARGWLAPCVRAGTTSRYGHPLVLGRELLEELRAFPAARPLSDLRALSAPLLALEVASAAILDDLDTPADLARLRAREL